MVFEKDCNTEDDEYSMEEDSTSSSRADSKPAGYGMQRWKQKTAIVTGASSGIGEAISKKLVGCGMNVVGIARREERLNAIRDSIEKEKLAMGEAKFVPLKLDLTELDGLDEHLDRIDDELNGIHVLVNNAGISKLAPLIDADQNYWNKLFTINVFAVGKMTRSVLKVMERNKFTNGHFINISSLAGSNSGPAMPNMVPYYASKRAVTAISEGLRAELSDLGSQIKVTNVSPGLVKTEILKSSGLLEVIPDEAPRLEPLDVAEAVAFALSTPKNVVISELTIQAVTESMHVRIPKPTKKKISPDCGSPKQGAMEL